MSAVTVITPPTLDELAATINREHQLVLEGVSGVIEHAIRAGEALVEVRARVLWGEWMPWLEKNFPYSLPTAYRYIRCAENKSLASKAESIESLASGAPELSPLARGRRVPHHYDIVALHDSGMRPVQISKTLGVSYKTVESQLLTPEQRREKMKRESERLKKKRAQRSAERKALERQERDAAMKKLGGDAWDAYLLVRKLAPLLESLKLNSAYHRCTAIEDDLVKAVKTSP